MRCPSCRSIVDAGASVTLLRCKVCNTKFSEEDGLPDDAGAAAIGEVPEELTDPEGASPGSPALADPEELGLGIGMIPPDMVTDDATVADESIPPTPIAAGPAAVSSSADEKKAPPPGAWGRRPAPAAGPAKAPPLSGPAARTMPDVVAPVAPRSVEAIAATTELPALNALDTWGEPPAAAGAIPPKPVTPSPPAPAPSAAKPPAPRPGRLSPTPPAGVTVTAPAKPATVSGPAAPTAPDFDVSSPALPKNAAPAAKAESTKPVPPLPPKPQTPVAPPTAAQPKPPKAVTPEPAPPPPMAVTPEPVPPPMAAIPTKPEVVAKSAAVPERAAPAKPPVGPVPGKPERPPSKASRVAPTAPDLELPAVKVMPRSPKPEPPKAQPPKLPAPPVREVEEPSGVFVGAKSSPPAASLASRAAPTVPDAKSSSAAGVVPPLGLGLGEDTVAEEDLSPPPAPPVTSAKSVLERIAGVPAPKAASADTAARAAATKSASAEVVANKVASAKLPTSPSPAELPKPLPKTAVAATDDPTGSIVAAPAPAARPPLRPNTAMPPKKPDVVAAATAEPGVVRGTLPPNRTPANAFIDDTVPEPKPAPRPAPPVQTSADLAAKPGSLRVSPVPRPLDLATGGGTIPDFAKDDPENTVGDDDMPPAVVGVVSQEKGGAPGVSRPTARPEPPVAKKGGAPRRPGDLFERTDARQKSPEMVDAERKAAEARPQSKDSVFEKTDARRPMPSLDEAGPAPKQTVFEKTGGRIPAPPPLDSEIFDPSADTVAGSDTNPGDIPAESGGRAAPLAPPRALPQGTSSPAVLGASSDDFSAPRSRTPLIVGLFGGGFLLLVLFAVAVWKIVPAVLGGASATPTPYAVATPDTIASAAPTGTATADVIATPEPTPEPTPEVTPEPTPEPTPVRTLLAVKPTPKPTAAPKKLTQQDLDFMLAKADVLLAEGKLVEARTQYLKLIASAPKWGPPHYGLANVYERQKDLPKACKEWRKFLELSPAARGSTTAAKKVSTCR